MRLKHRDEQYFEWIVELLCGERFSKAISYRKLLTYLHSVKFRYSILRDENRASDGESLRYHYALLHDVPEPDKGLPSSVLEVMTALAIRCEETITTNTELGDRTGQWFWGMITSLGLGSMTDYRFKESYVEETVERFLNRDYEPDGHGGLFVIEDCETDLRTVEIWYQMCWYLNTLM